MDWGINFSGWMVHMFQFGAERLVAQMPQTPTQDWKADDDWWSKKTMIGKQIRTVARSSLDGARQDSKLL